MSYKQLPVLDGPSYEDWLVTWDKQDFVNERLSSDLALYDGFNPCNLNGYLECLGHRSVCLTLACDQDMPRVLGADVVKKL